MEGSYLFLLFCRKNSYLFFHWKHWKITFYRKSGSPGHQQPSFKYNDSFEVIWFWRVLVATRKLDIQNFQHLFVFPPPLFLLSQGWNPQNLMVKVIITLYCSRLCIRKKTVPCHRHLDPLCLTGIFQLLAIYFPVQLWRMWEYPQVLSEGKNIENINMCGTTPH